MSGGLKAMRSNLFYPACGNEMQNPQQYTANYYYQKLGVGSRTRTTIVGSVSQHLQGATTESAVLIYLKKKHPGCEIMLMNLTWN